MRGAPSVGNCGQIAEPGNDFREAVEWCGLQETALLGRQVGEPGLGLWQRAHAGTQRFVAWRLIEDGAADGAWNMGVDEALHATAARSGQASLRLYSWRGAWLSLGYAQRLDEQRQAQCAGAGVGVVRRASGGRAVLHGCDLTYCLAAPEDALPAGLRGSYALVCAALVCALREIGVAAQSSGGDLRAPGGAEFDCFARPASDEICVGGRKLAGSAQRRAAGAVVQHGSLRLRPDAAPAARAAGLHAAGATSLLEEGWKGDEAALRRALVAAFSQALGGALQPGDLDPQERALAALRSPFAPLATGSGAA